MNIAVPQATVSWEAAHAAVEAAVRHAESLGVRINVGVTDVGGNLIAFLRMPGAFPQSIQFAIDKAYTAISFRTDTLEFAKLTQPGQAAYGVRQIPRVVAVGGGVQISGAGQLIGAIGVSGAPTGSDDEACAKAGIAAIRDDVEL